MNWLTGRWYNALSAETGTSYHCGYCGNNVGPSSYYHLEFSGISGVSIGIYICPTCNRPTYLNEHTNEQYPGPPYGNEISYLPEDIEQLYKEAKGCIKINAYTSSVLSCRKLLMNVSVSKGAESGKSFASYVTFLVEKNFVPPESEDWVDHIRKKGNEATHEIPSISKDDAVELLDFTEMLLRFVYEMPGRMSKYKSESE